MCLNLFIYFFFFPFFFLAFCILGLLTFKSSILLLYTNNINPISNKILNTILLLEMVRVYIHDNNNDVDFRENHDSGIEVTLPQLKRLGVLYFHMTDPAQVDQLAKERGYKNQDLVNISIDSFKGDVAAMVAQLNIFYREHLHEDEEIRYIVDGDGFFDIRNEFTDEWVRCYVDKGDLLIVPAGVYHRFTLTNKNFIVAKRLFKDEPRWEAHNKSSEVDQYKIHKEYLSSIEI